MRQQALDQIEAFASQMQPGDELWHTSSKFRGPLAGWEGVGIVRDGTLIEELVIAHY